MLGDDPSFDYHDYSLIQTWVGKDKVTVGTVIGPQLYSIVWDLLNVGCRPVVSNTCVNDATNICFQTTAMDKYPGGPKYSWTCLGGLRMEWRTSEIRKLLIGAVAGTLEALTLNQVGGDSNCFMVNDERACNVGDVVRVNLPDLRGKRNYMHIKLWNFETRHGSWDCCSGDNRARVDRAIDGLGGEISEAFEKPFSRDTRCIINGDKVCGGGRL
ncbi:hypothetical protein BDU57DRAFT_489495 [Ampelomyces quisqualis]|uniref:Uncharacterized protein n=1 Tax=Ampelomyces quisqualis TaxID=50730 RepID=A0A6A5R1L8_AMPQU|nr:hypothetical protein BDU57DRAFT_489495 [Ampelomyces quisqualis]